MPDQMPSLAELQKQTADALASLQTPDNVQPPQRPLSDVIADTTKAFESARDPRDTAKRARDVRMQTPDLSATPSQTVTAMATGLGAGLVKGLFSPVSAFMPDAFNEQLDLWEEDSTRKALGMMARSQYKTTYDASPTMKGVLANAPGTVGDIGGMLIPFAGTYEAARSAFKVGEAATLTAKMARTMMAAGSTGGLLSAAAKLDPGESRWGKIATDSVAMGAFEMVGIPAMLKAWKEESPSLAKGLLAKTGMESKELEAQLTAVRAGVPADEKVLDAVLNHAKGNPELEQTPIVLQAAKQKEAKRKLTQPKTVLDPLLASEDVTHAAQVKVTVGDQPPTTVNITRDPGNPQHFTNQVNGLRTQLKTLTDQGVDIKVTDVVSGNAEDANEVLKALQGKTVKPPNPDKAKRKVPGAAPPASVAENGDVPVVGDKVTVAEPDKPLQQGVVASKALADVRDQRVTNIGPPPGVTDRRMDELVQKFGGTQTVESAPPVSATAPPPLKATGRASRKADAVAMAAEQSTVRVTMPDATMRDVPLAQIQTPLTVGVKQSMTLKPHLDGSDRHAIIHLNDNLISFEGRGASKDPGSNYFRSELFPNTNPDAPFGQDPRLFIHNDGGLTISVNKLEGQADLVTQKRAAKLLIDHGVSADTPVAVASAITEHSPGLASDKGRLRDLATAELPLANMSKLSEDAANRGLTATPFGDKVTLKSRNGFSRTFANSLEAHEAVLRMPLAENNVKVEAELEKAWKMGSERAWDPDVDVTKYVPLAQQEQGLTEVAQGKRPLTPVYTTDGEALTSTIRQLEKNMGVPENTFRVQFLPAMDDVKRKAAVIYNNDAVALAAAKNRSSLTYLGVTAKDPAAILQQLSTKGKGHGIFVLAGRDAESAALYAKWREQGSKELWETGRIEADALGPYRRYSKQAKSVINYPGAGDEQYFPTDISDIQKPPEGVSFTPADARKPPMWEPLAEFEPDLSFGKGKPSYDLEHLPPEGEVRDTSGPVAKVLGQRLRPMLELSKDMSVRTGVPFYDWYRAIENGRNKVEQVVNPLLEGVRDLAKPLTRNERKQVQLYFEASISELPIGELEKKLPAKVKEAASNLKDVYSNFFQSQGFSQGDVKSFFSIFPELRKADGEFRYAMKGGTGIPKIGQLLSKDLDNGILNIDSREFDFQRIANRLIRSTATEKYLQPSWERVSTELEAYTQAKRISKDVRETFVQYMSEVLHMPDTLQVSLARATKQVFGKLGGRVSDAEAQDVVSMFVQMNYFANMAWKPGIAMRNLLQTLQTSLPIIGTKDTMEGWRIGMKWWKDPKLQEEMVRRGVVEPNGIYEPLQELQSLTRGVSGAAGKGLDVFLNQGTKWHANTDQFNKVVAYWGQFNRAKRVGQEYLDKKIDFSTFLEKSRLDMRDAPNGPFVQKIKTLLDAGKLDAMADVGGKEFAQSTQFVYSRGNAPYVMQSTLGRFLLQYGTWPAWYGENLRNMLARGSYKNRIGALARWTGVQSAMFGTANALFGVDLARWTFFAPLGYTGGPAAQMAMQGASTLNATLDPSTNDPVARINKARFEHSLTHQALPLPMGAATDFMRTYNSMTRGNWQDAARQFIGMPTAKGSLIP